MNTWINKEDSLGLEVVTPTSQPSWSAVYSSGSGAEDELRLTRTSGRADRGFSLIVYGMLLTGRLRVWGWGGFEDGSLCLARAPRSRPAPHRKHRTKLSPRPAFARNTTTAPQLRSAPTPATEQQVGRGRGHDDIIHPQAHKRAGWGGRGLQRLDGFIHTGTVPMTRSEGPFFAINKLLLTVTIPHTVDGENVCDALQWLNDLSPKASFSCWTDLLKTERSGLESRSSLYSERSQQLGDDKSLSEHLKLPIQRINDYQLLLKVTLHNSVTVSLQYNLHG
uniref:DH domain-containing protein n=1 Tax=Timema poppense TaxID=170557 RepID=A0A7R9CFZ3_TIMPO|nr:unnamed protein product [Timema poppensis]